jgi:hypothetical protein
MNPYNNREAKEINSGVRLSNKYFFSTEICLKNPVNQRVIICKICIENRGFFPLESRKAKLFGYGYYIN